jgi:hypothetical protein
LVAERIPKKRKRGKGGAGDFDHEEARAPMFEDLRICGALRLLEG